MEAFISEITTNKINKFNQIKKEINKRNQSHPEISEKQHVLIEEIYRCLDEREETTLESVIDKWLNKQSIQLPISTLCELVEFSSSMGNTELFHRLNSYTKNFEQEFYKENSCYFEALNLELDWKTGRNIDQLIENFEALYRTSISDEVKSKPMMKLFSVMIKDCIAKKGESFVIKLKDKIVKLCNESQDYQLLFELWKNLFER